MEMVLAPEQIQEVGRLSRIEFLDSYERARAANDYEAADLLLKLRGATDVELFSFAFFPHWCESPFNQYHRDFFASARFGERAVRRARCAPRGSAKSTCAAFFKPIHDLCYGLEQYIIVISNTEAQAAAKVRDIRDELRDNDDLSKFYGIWFPTATVGETKFEACAHKYRCRFEAYGVGTQIRGIRKRHKRPTKVILDDVEHSEEVFNESLREKRLNWFREDVSKVGDLNTNIEVVGTMLHRESMLKNVMDNPAYESKSYKSVVAWSAREDLWNEWTRLYTNMDNDDRHAVARTFFDTNTAEMLKGTQVLWPEREPYEYLMRERIEIGHRAFMKEKQNEPLGSEEKVFTKFHWYHETEQGGKRGILIESSNVFYPFEQLRPLAAIDPATGQTKAKKGKKGDFAVLGIGFKDPKGRLLVHHDWTKRAPPSEQIAQMFTLWEIYKYEQLGVETNLYRNLLMPNIMAAKKEWQKTFPEPMECKFYDIEQTENKEKRIHALEPKVTHGMILFNRALSQELKNQFDDFPHADHDDCPDMTEMMWGLVNNRYKMVPVSLNPLGR